MSKETLRTCDRGHSYYKSSDCPVCPTCAQDEKSAEGFLSTLSAPARRALEGAGITTIDKLSKHTERELVSLHGFGPASIPKLRSILKEAGLEFRTAARLNLQK